MDKTQAFLQSHRKEKKYFKPNDNPANSEKPQEEGDSAEEHREHEETEVPGCTKVNMDSIKHAKPDIDSCYEIKSENQESVASSSRE